MKTPLIKKSSGKMVIWDKKKDQAFRKLFRQIIPRRFDHVYETARKHLAGEHREYQELELRRVLSQVLDIERKRREVNNLSLLIRTMNVHRIPKNILIDGYPIEHL